jgi:hypothetical protein
MIEAVIYFLGPCGNRTRDAEPHRFFDIYSGVLVCLL